MCTHAPGRRSAASARTNNTKHVPERADHELFGSYLTKSLLRVPEFRWVAAFRGVYEHPTHLTSDDDAPTTRKKNPPRKRPCVPTRPRSGWAVGMAGRWCSSRARARSCGVSRREAQGRLNHKPPQRRGGMWLGMWDAPRGTGSVFSCSMIVLNIPRRLRWPHRADSKRNVHNNS